MAEEGNIPGFHVSPDQPEDLVSSTINTSEKLSVEVPVTSVSLATKRKSCLENPDHLANAKRTGKESPTINSPVPSRSQEEIKMEADLVAARAQITKLECDIKYQQSLYEEMKIQCEKERELSMEQHKRDEKALSDMQNLMQMALKEHQESETKWEKERTALEKKLAELEAKLQEAANVKVKEEYEGDLLRKEVAKLTIGSQDITSLKEQLSKQTLEIQYLKRKLNVAEYEKNCYKAWQLYSKTAHRRVFMTSELEKEVVRLRSAKYLLEEQVTALNASIESLQPAQLNLHEAKVKVAVLESSLEAWETAAKAHGVKSPRALKAALESKKRRTIVHRATVGSQTSLPTEIERIKTALQAQGTDICCVEAACLKRQLEETQKDLESKKRELKTLNKEYKEVINNFIGFSVDSMGNGNYRLRSIYAKSEEECLYLTILKGVIMIKCGESLQKLLEVHELEYSPDKSVPVFVGAVTKALYIRNKHNLECIPIPRP